MTRKLRIAVFVFFGVLTFLLIVLWARSHWREYALSRSSDSSLTLISVNSGKVTFLRYCDSGPVHHWAFRSRTANEPLSSRFSAEDGDFIVVVPMWCLAVLSGLTTTIILLCGSPSDLASGKLEVLPQRRS